MMNLLNVWDKEVAVIRFHTELAAGWTDRQAISSETCLQVCVLGTLKASELPMSHTYTSCAVCF